LKKTPKLENHKFFKHCKETNNLVQVEKGDELVQVFKEKQQIKAKKYKVLKFFFCVM